MGHNRHHHRKNGGDHNIENENMNTAALQDEGAKERDEELSDEGSWGFEDLPEGIRDYAIQAKEFLLRKFEENPNAALAMAFGAGALVATVLGTSRQGRKAVRRVVKSLPKSIRKPVQKAMPI
jgi:hypothetical protein